MRATRYRATPSYRQPYAHKLGVGVLICRGLDMRQRRLWPDRRIVGQDQGEVAGRLVSLRCPVYLASSAVRFLCTHSW